MLSRIFCFCLLQRWLGTQADRDFMLPLTALSIPAQAPLLQAGEESVVITKVEESGAMDIS